MMLRFINEIEKNVMDLVRSQKITPKARGYFIAKNYFFWTLFYSSIIAGAVSFSVVVFLVSNYDWFLYKHLDISLVRYVLISLPYFWILGIAFFSFGSFLYFKATKYGYRYNLQASLSGAVFSMLVLGFIFLKIGWAGQTHAVFLNIPLYDKLVFDKDDVWNNPQKGLLLGKVVRVSNNSSFTIQDRRGNLWEVRLDPVSLPNGASVLNGQTVRLIGKSKEGNTFLANISNP